MERNWLGQKAMTDNPLTASQCAIPCFSCRESLDVNPVDTAYACSCGAQNAMRLCPNCSRVVHIPTSLMGKTVKCLSCGKQNRWPQWESHPLSAARYAEIISLQRHQERTITGATVAAEGFPPLAPGIGCRLEFADDAIIVSARMTASEYNQTAAVALGDVRLLRVEGRGAITTTSMRGGGAGRAAAMAAYATVPGAGLLAAAVPSLRAKRTTTIETIVHLNAGARELMMVTSQATPQVLQVRLAPVFKRIDELQAITANQPSNLSVSSSPSVADELAKLAKLRDDGVLSAEEFSSSKARLLAGA